MERMKPLGGRVAALLSLIVLGSCQDMVLRDTVVEKVVEAQNPPAKDGRLTLEYNATNQAFGSTFNAPTTKAGTSPVLHFTIRNTGLTNLTGNAVSVVNPTGTGGTFAVTSQPASPIAPGGASNFDLTFNAAATTGTAGATLQIVSNDVSHPTFTVTLAAKVDGTAPTGSVTINGGAVATNSRAFSLTLTGSDTGGATLTQMQFSTDGSNFSAPEAFSTTKAFTYLVEPDGLKTVYLKLIDSVGNVSAAVSDSITYDTTKPTASFSVTNVATGVSKSTAVSLTFNETMQATSIASGTNAVQLLLPNGTSVPLQTQPNGYASNGTNNVILRPFSNLLCGTIYTVKVNTGAKDLAGNAINTYTSTFTTEDDPYENTYTGTGAGSGNDNDLSDRAFDLTVPGLDQGHFMDNVWTQTRDLYGLAVLKNTDYYKLYISDPFTLHLRVYFSNGASNPATDGAASALASHDLRLTVFGPSGPQISRSTTLTDATNDRNYEFSIDQAGTYIIMVFDFNNYNSPQTYNLFWSAEPGI